MARAFLTHPITDDSALGGSVIERSLRFNNDDNTRLTRTIGSTSNRRTFTYSFWIKRTMKSAEQYVLYNGHATGVPYFDTRFEANDHQLQFIDYTGSHAMQLRTERRFRDVGSWYHIVIAIDTTQGTASNRAKLYVNGVQETDFSVETYPSQNHDTGANVSGHIQVLGTLKASTSNDLDGYLAEFHFIDGQQITPSNFGYTEDATGIWRPKKYEGTYGTNGFYLDFSDNSATTAVTLGKDRSGNGNDFTPSNLSVSAGEGNDSLLDTPTNNFCTLNPLDVYGDGITEEIKNGNLDAKNTSGGSYRTTRSTFYVTTGKWYWEVKVLAVGTVVLVGVAGKDYNAGSGARRAYNSYNGQKYIGSGSSYGATYTTNDIIGIALDLDNGTITFYKNGASQGVAFTDMLTAMVDGGWTPIFNGYGNSEGAFNFGQRPFSYTPPTGFKTLCSNNILNTDVPSIIKAKEHFDTLLYTGNGATQSITGLEFSPDFVWIKERSSTSSHTLGDTVRGPNKILQSNANDEELEPSAGAERFKSFDSNGFTHANSGAVNQSGQTYVAWCWKAGGASVSNSDGSITSTISANQEGGFSIVTWSGTGSAATIGHGLGRAPKVIIVKRRTGGAQDWFVNNGMIFNDYGKYYELNKNDVSNASNTNVFPNTAPTSTVFSVGTDSAVNASGSTYVGYVWSQIPGLSHFGYWTGNGSTDGPFVYTGFKPRFIIYRKATNENWHMLDTKRDAINPNSFGLDPNLSNAESSDANIQLDILSNGFKARASHGTSNTNGTNYFYYTWAEVSGNTPYQTEPSAR